MKTNFKNRLIVLTSIIGVLVLLYAASFIFSSEKSDKRLSSYVWLDEKFASRIDRITINTKDGSSESNVELINRGGWVILVDNIEYPARRLRIEDFLNIFTASGIWPVRSARADGHAGFGLEAGQADRVTFYGGTSILLDVLIGHENVFGNEVSMRKFAQNEVRSGDNRIRTYITSPVSSWYNLRLIPEENNESVQRLTVYNEGESINFSLQGRNWNVSDSAGLTLENPDRANVDSYIRTVLALEGDNFAGLVSKQEEALASASRIVFEFGNGTTAVIDFTEPDEQGRRLATVSGKDYIYSVPSWAANRVFRDIGSFE